MTKAYSYIRFSISKQELGDSLRRQMALAEKYAAAHGLELDNVSYRDLGVSAFKRKNIEKGALAAFIDAVKTGKIKKGSYLLVEQFDRLSRADIDVAVRLLLDLVHSGIILVTLDDEKVWDMHTVKDIGNLILSIVFMSRANNESEAKSSRLSGIWNEKKMHAAKTGKIATRECPRWLRVNDDKTAFVVLEDRVESIRKVFNLRLNGQGVVSIVARANKERWPAPAKGTSWHTSLVGRLLRNRALLGEYQPHKNYDDDGNSKRTAIGAPIAGFYPAVLDEQTFLRAIAVTERKGRFPGRRDANHDNWLQGILQCSCGNSFVRKNKGAGYARYYCTGRNRGLTDCPSIATKVIEDAVIDVVMHVAPQYFAGSARAEELKSRIDMLEGELAAAKHSQNRFMDAVTQTTIPIPMLKQRLEDSQTTVLKIQETVRQARAEMADLTGNSETVFSNIFRAMKDVNSSDSRAALREDLSRLFQCCRVFPKEKYVQFFLRGNEITVAVPLEKDAIIPDLNVTKVPRADYWKKLEQVESMLAFLPRSVTAK